MIEFKKQLSRKMVATLFCCTILAQAKIDMPVFLLSGQSNMTGYASAGDLSADQKKTVDNVKIYMDLVWEGDASKLRKWLTLGPGFGSNANNIGPELFMGRTLSEAMPGKKIALIKCSSGSTYLGKSSDWLPPSSNNGNGGTLYKRMISTINTALKGINAVIDTTQYTPRWAGFVWLQGEFDAQDQNLANAYEKNLTNLINDIRKDLKISDLPVIIPMIDVQGQWRYNSTVRAANIAVTKKLTNVDTLDTKGFSTDGTHYKGQGQVKIGTYTAQRWLKMDYKYGPTVSAEYHHITQTSASLAPVATSRVLFDLSGRKTTTPDRLLNGTHPYTGVLLSKTSQNGQCLKMLFVGE